MEAPRLIEPRSASIIECGRVWNSSAKLEPYRVGASYLHVCVTLQTAWLLLNLNLNIRRERKMTGAGNKRDLTASTNTD